MKNVISIHSILGDFAPVSRPAATILPNQLFLLVMLILLTFFCVSGAAQQSEWTWMGGSNVLVPSYECTSSGCGWFGTYGTLGTPAAGNIPGSRYLASTWTDSSGRLWLFGGAGIDDNNNWGYLNDLWEFDPSTNEWTWMGGGNSVVNNGGQSGVYGRLGTPAAGNIPGGRSFAASWTDSSGYLWLFGGTGFDASGTKGDLNDLWEFNPSTNQWAWMGGSATVDSNGGQPGVYGTLGIPAAGNIPRGRNGASHWMDSGGNLWLFGGQAYNAAISGTGFLNDLWEFSPSTTEWAWMGGSSTIRGFYGISGVYGAIGSPAAGNTPGDRFGATNWTDNKGDLWLFGGWGDDGNGNLGDLNDLWEFYPSTNEWAWMGGGNTGGQSGVYGTLATPATGNIPGGRENAAGWTDGSGNLWLFAGAYHSGYFNDLWEFNPSKNEWAWMGGSGTVPLESGYSGIYGALGSPATGNMPGSRESAASWTDSSGNLWLFGGVGFDASDQFGYLNDLWKYQASTATLPVAVPPTFSLAAGTYTTAQTVNIADATPSATIYYTTDGSMPTANSSLYSGAITVSSTETLEAIAIAAGYTPSAVATASYTITPPAAAPTFSLSGGTYNTPQTITLSTTTSGASIHYTTDGSQPSNMAGTLYTGPITVSATTTISAIAFGSGLANSSVSTATYTIQVPPPPLLFTSTGSMETGRTAHSATLLPNGKVLIAGGTSDDAVTSLSGAELYDPATGAFSPTGSMGTARFCHTATLLQNGKVLIAGGFGPNETLSFSSAELYDPATGTFSPTGSMGTARAAHTATLLANGTVLIAGGLIAPYSVTNGAEVYDPATGSFSPTGSMTIAREQQMATLLPNEQVLIVGGGNWPDGILGSAELYDPVTGTFASTGGMNMPRVDHTATPLPDGEVLIAGGEECCYPALSSAELYNSATGIFSLTGSMETGRVGLTATLLLNGTVLIAGGTNSGNNNPYLASAELYYPTAGAFTPAGNMTTARDGFTATLLASGAVLIAGGVNLTSAPNALSSAELYGATTAATPVFSVPAGTYNAVQTVGISDFTPGAAIYYTLDGSTPTTGSNLYSTPITVSSTQTLEAIAFASGLSASNVAAATYTIAPPAAAPVFSPSGGSYAEPQAVTLSTTASGASIHYTTDGSTPSDTAGTLYTGPITVLSSATIKAIAFGGVWSDSAVSTATYLIRPIAPAFSPSGGTFTLPQTVTLSTLTSGAAINYTTDGSTPSNTAGTLYSGPITVSASTTIKAIAYASGLPNSTVSSATYKIEPITPTFSPSGGTFTVAQTVTLSSLTSGAAINYTTDGSTPSNTAGTLYSGPITVSATTTIKAIAYAPGLTNSTVSTATYNIEPIAPALIPSGGTFTAPLTVMLSSATSGVFINYTTDGSTPSNTVGTLYAGPIAVNATTTIKAIAFGAGLTNSTVATATYKVEVLPPAFSPSGGTFTAPQVVTMICATSGASIRYTTDGSLPSDTVGTLYTGPIPISSTTTIKAIAFASGLTSSTVSTATYSVQVLAPAFSPPGGTFTAPQLLTMNSATSGASIRYTTDGSTPSETVGTLYAGPITLSSTTTIKAIAFVAGLTDSTVSTATFKIGD